MKTHMMNWSNSGYSTKGYYCTFESVSPYDWTVVSVIVSDDGMDYGDDDGRVIGYTINKLQLSAATINTSDVMNFATYKSL